MRDTRTEIQKNNDIMRKRQRRQMCRNYALVGIQSVLHFLFLPKNYRALQDKSYFTNYKSIKFKRENYKNIKIFFHCQTWQTPI